MKYFYYKCLRMFKGKLKDNNIEKITIIEFKREKIDTIQKTFIENKESSTYIEQKNVNKSIVQSTFSCSEQVSCQLIDVVSSYCISEITDN